ncbi:MAG TPA: SDR family NAD(P)-dependent oxidoreductase [Chloroflexota bacterium]|nr:SDR family NAD(P)-dependent oxidoreductase [Chloroflexota bacterium]
MIDLTGRVALVTGAGSGIGRATALMLGQAGARVAYVDVRAARAAAAAAEARERGYDALGLAADVADPAAIGAAVQQALDRWGGLDVLVANAGISSHQAVVDMDEAAWDTVLAVDLDGVFYTVRAALPALRRSRHGRIVCTASHYGLIGQAGLAHYSAAKGGVIGLVRSLAQELGPDGVTVNAVAPGPVLTGITERTPEQVRARAARLPLGRLGQPEDVAGLILFLASDLAAWLTGQVLPIDGGDLLLGRT